MWSLKHNCADPWLQKLIAFIWCFRISNSRILVPNQREPFILGCVCRRRRSSSPKDIIYNQTQWSACMLLSGQISFSRAAFLHENDAAARCQIRRIVSPPRASTNRRREEWNERRSGAAREHKDKIVCALADKRITQKIAPRAIRGKLPYIWRMLRHV